MVLAVDIGNTNIVLGLYENDAWKKTWRLETNKDENDLFYSYKINDLFWEVGVPIDSIEYIIFSTVVPELKDVFYKLLNNLNDNPVYILDKNSYDLFDIDIPSPIEIGTDIVANALAAHHNYGGNLIVIDFGTALTYTAINSYGDILGVNITLGVKSAINSLVSKTSQLPPVDVRFPIDPIGKNSVDSIQNGVLIGFIGQVKYMIQVLSSHLGYESNIVVTGGMSSLIAPHLGIVDFVNPNLTLEGLLVAGKFFHNQMIKDQLS